jgi:hypothetical protein
MTKAEVITKLLNALYDDVVGNPTIDDIRAKLELSFEAGREAYLDGYCPIRFETGRVFPPNDSVSGIFPEWIASPEFQARLKAALAIQRERSNPD